MATRVFVIIAALMLPPHAAFSQEKQQHSAQSAQSSAQDMCATSADGAEARYLKDAFKEREALEVSQLGNKNKTYPVGDWLYGKANRDKGLYRSYAQQSLHSKNVMKPLDPAFYPALDPRLESEYIKSIRSWDYNVDRKVFDHGRYLRFLSRQLDCPSVEKIFTDAVVSTVPAHLGSEVMQFHTIEEGLTALDPEYKRLWREQITMISLGSAHTISDAFKDLVKKIQERMAKKATLSNDEAITANLIQNRELAEKLLGVTLAKTYYDLLTDPPKPEKAETKWVLQNGKQNSLLAGAPKTKDKVVENFVFAANKELAETQTYSPGQIRSLAEAFKTLTGDERIKTRQWLAERLVGLKKGEVASNGDWIGRQRLTEMFTQAIYEMDKAKPEGDTAKVEESAEGATDDRELYSLVIETEANTLANASQEVRDLVKTAEKYVSAYGRAALPAENRIALAQLNPIDRGIISELLTRQDQGKAVTEAVLKPSSANIIGEALKDNRNREGLHRVLNNTLEALKPPSEVRSLDAQTNEQRHALRNWALKEIGKHKPNSPQKYALGLLISSIDMRGHEAELAAVKGLVTPSNWQEKRLTHSIEAEKKAREESKDVNKEAISQFQKWLDGQGRGLPSEARTVLYGLNDADILHLKRLISMADTSEGVKAYLHHFFSNPKAYLSQFAKPEDQGRLDLLTNVVERIDPNFSNYIERHLHNSLQTNFISDLTDGTLSTDNNKRLQEMARAQYNLSIEEAQANASDEAQKQAIGEEAKKDVDKKIADIAKEIENNYRLLAAERVVGVNPKADTSKILAPFGEEAEKAKQVVQNRVGIHNFFGQTMEPFLAAQGRTLATLPPVGQEGHAEAIDKAGYNSPAFAELQKLEQERAEEVRRERHDRLQKATQAHLEDLRNKETRKKAGCASCVTVMGAGETAECKPEAKSECKDETFWATKLAELDAEQTKTREAYETKQAELQGKILDVKQATFDELRKTSDAAYDELAKKFYETHKASFQGADESTLLALFKERLKESRKLHQQAVALGKAVNPVGGQQNSANTPENKQLLEDYAKQLNQQADQKQLAPTLAKDVQNAGKAAYNETKKKEKESKDIVAELGKFGIVHDGVTFDFSKARLHEMDQKRLEELLTKYAAYTPHSNNPGKANPWEELKRTLEENYDSVNHLSVVPITSESAVRFTFKDGKETFEFISRKEGEAEVARLKDELKKQINEDLARLNDQASSFLNTAGKVLGGKTVLVKPKPNDKARQQLGLPVPPSPSSAPAPKVKIPDWVGNYVDENGHLTSKVDRELSDLQDRVWENIHKLEQYGALEAKYHGNTERAAEIAVDMKKRFKDHLREHDAGLRGVEQDLWWMEFGIKTAATTLATGGTGAALSKIPAIAKAGWYLATAEKVANFKKAEAVVRTVGGATRGLTMTRRMLIAEVGLNAYNKIQAAKKYYSEDIYRDSNYNGIPDSEDIAADNLNPEKVLPASIDARGDGIPDWEQRGVLDNARSIVPRFGETAARTANTSWTFMLSGHLGALAGKIGVPQRYQGMAGMAVGTGITEFGVKPTALMLTSRDGQYKMSDKVDIFKQIGKNMIYAAPVDTGVAGYIIKNFPGTSTAAREAISWGASYATNAIVSSAMGVAEHYRLFGAPKDTPPEELALGGYISGTGERATTWQEAAKWSWIESIPGDMAAASGATREVKEEATKMVMFTGRPLDNIRNDVGEARFRKALSEIEAREIDTKNDKHDKVIEELAGNAPIAEFKQEIEQFKQDNSGYKLGRLTFGGNARILPHVARLRARASARRYEARLLSPKTILSSKNGADIVGAIEVAKLDLKNPDDIGLIKWAAETYKFSPAEFETHIISEQARGVHRLDMADAVASFQKKVRAREKEQKRKSAHWDE